MKKQMLFLFSFVVIGVVILNIPGCGKKDDFPLEKINSLWEEQIILLDDHISRLEKLSAPAESAAAIHDFSKKLDPMVTRFNEFLLKHAEFKKKMEETNDEKKQEAWARLIAVGLFTDNVVNMQVRRFSQQKEMTDALKQLVEIQKKMRLDGEPRSDARADEMFNKLVFGAWVNVSPRVQGFFSRLRTASITSRLKITMRNIFLLGRAFEAFRKENNSLPNIKELDQLKTTGDFIPRYFQDEKSLPLEDGWGNFLYFKAKDGDYWIGSAGSDGNFQGFEQTGLYESIEGGDIVYSNGHFTMAPKKLLNPAPNGSNANTPPAPPK